MSAEQIDNDTLRQWASLCSGKAGEAAIHVQTHENPQVRLVARNQEQQFERIRRFLLSFVDESASSSESDGTPTDNNQSIAFMWGMKQIEARTDSWCDQDTQREITTERLTLQNVVAGIIERAQSSAPATPRETTTSVQDVADWLRAQGWGRSAAAIESQFGRSPATPRSDNAV